MKYFIEYCGQIALVAVLAIIGVMIVAYVGFSLYISVQKDLIQLEDSRIRTEKERIRDERIEKHQQIIDSIYKTK